MTTSIDAIGELLAQALLPLGEIAGQPEIVERALRSLGFAPPAGIDLGVVVSLDPRDVVEKLLILQRSSEEEQKDASVMSGRAGALIAAVARLISDIRTFAESLPTALAAAGDYAEKSKIAEQLPRRLLDLLVVQAVGQVSPPAAFVLRTLGIFGFDPYPDVPDIYQVAHRRTVVRYERFEDLFSDPAKLIVKEYGWSTPTFDAESLLSNLGLLLQSLGIRPYMREMPPAVEEALTGQSIPNAADDPSPQLLVSMTTPGAVMPVDLSLSLHRLRATAAGASDAGLELVALVSGEASISIPLSTLLSLRLDASLDLGAGVGIALRPTGAELRAGFLTGGRPGTAASGQLGVGIHLKRADGASTQFLAVPGGSLIEASEIYFEAGCSLAVGAVPDPYIVAAIVGGHVAVTLGGADGFLANVLPAGGINSTFDLKARWSRSQGFRFDGSGQLEIAIPVHKAVGPFRVDSISIGLGVAGGGLQLITAVSGALELGPLHATIDKVGVQGNLQFVTGNLGNANLALGFQPPSGVGLSIDTKAISGGGFLSFDSIKKQYSGVLALSVSNSFSLKVIGILDTKMPDGSEGFSLLLIVSVEFSPIQLGYGFTLNGVGGLAAFNRSMALKALQDGVRNRTLDSIMFPPDPVANSSKIISDLQTVFPPVTGRFVFAPMVKIGWGSSILVIEIGLALELPSPLRLAIMGKVHLLLPPADPDKSQEERLPIELHMAVLGTLDFDQGEISVTASLYHSFIAIFPVTGGMVTRIRWGRDPMFLLSVGGFNPRFTPPPGMDPVDRVGIQLSYDKNGIRAGLRLESYFAVTANSFQMGARLDAYAEVVNFATLRGYLGFDALIEAPPFHFIVDLFGGVEVKVFGFGFACDLLLTLSGPGPVEGNGFVKVEFFGEHHVDVHFLIGEPAAEPPLPTVDPYEELVLAVQDRRNWTAALPDQATMLVTLRTITAAEAGQPDASSDTPPPLLVHPLGELSLRQRVLPLGLRLERFGGATPSSPGPFSIASFEVGDDLLVPTANNELRDAFARGQFSNLSEDQKLTLPAFESMICGHQRVVADEVSIGAQQATEFEVEMIVIDDKALPPPEPLRFKLLDGALARSTQCGAAKIMGVPPKNGGKYAGPSAGIQLRGPSYTVASSDTMLANGVPRYRTHAEAEADPLLGGKPVRRFQVVEEYELA